MLPFVDADDRLLISWICSECVIACRQSLTGMLGGIRTLGRSRPSYCRCLPLICALPSHFFRAITSSNIPPRAIISAPASCIFAGCRWHRRWRREHGARAVGVDLPISAHSHDLSHARFSRYQLRSLRSTHHFDTYLKVASFRSDRLSVGWATLPLSRPRRSGVMSNSACLGFHMWTSRVVS